MQSRRQNLHLSNHIGRFWLTNQDVVWIRHVWIVFFILLNVSCQFISAENVVVFCKPKFSKATDYSKLSRLPLHHKVYEQKVTWRLPLQMFHWVIIKLKLSVPNNIPWFSGFIVFRLTFAWFSGFIVVRLAFAECAYFPPTQS